VVTKLMEPSGLLSDLGLFLTERWQEWRLKVRYILRGKRLRGPLRGPRIQHNRERLRTTAATHGNMMDQLPTDLEMSYKLKDQEHIR
jgi:hypothetical protein